MTLRIGVIASISAACLFAGCQRRDEPTQGGAQSTTTPGTMSSEAPAGAASAAGATIPGSSTDSATNTGPAASAPQGS
jgi:hypothetical protein